MEAQVGDRLIIMGRYVHRPVRIGEILEVRGSAGAPPYIVRWSDTDHETLVYPGSDARIEPASARSTARVGTRVERLGRPAHDARGEPTLDAAEAVTLVRDHIDLETIRTTDHDSELWSLWQDEARRAQDDAHNADVLDRVLARVRVGD